MHTAGFAGRLPSLNKMNIFRWFSPITALLWLLQWPPGCGATWESQRGGKPSSSCLQSWQRDKLSREQCARAGSVCVRVCVCVCCQHSWSSSPWDLDGENWLYDKSRCKDTLDNKPYRLVYVHTPGHRMTFRWV